MLKFRSIPLFAFLLQLTSLDNNQKFSAMKRAPYGRSIFKRKLEQFVDKLTIVLHTMISANKYNLLEAHTSIKLEANCLYSTLSTSQKWTW